MSDVFTKEKRSHVMSQIKGRGNKETELALVAIFRAANITGWRRHANIFGRPDFVFRQIRTVVFVDGCFWHCCPKHGRPPKLNASFWAKKLAGNKARDNKVTRHLRNAGWKVVRVWEHELTKKNRKRFLGRLMRIFQQPDQQT